MSQKEQTQIINRLTAMWAFNEAALGGILHAFHIPLTGLLVGGFASLFISLIFRFSEDRKAVLRATLIVLIIKFLVSPHTPLLAYFSVAFQGIVGYLIFSRKIPFAFSAVSLAVISSVFSSVQKIFFLTVMFGENFWTAINIYAKFVLKQFFNSEFNLNISLLIISLYLTIHLLGGIFFGILAVRFNKKKDKLMAEVSSMQISSDIESGIETAGSGRRRKMKHIMNIMIALFLVSGLVLTLIYSESSENSTIFMIMIIRSIIVFTLWLFLSKRVIYPMLKKYAEKSKKKYAAEIESMLCLFPSFRQQVKHNIIRVKKEKGIRAIWMFINLTIAGMLFHNISEIRE